LIKGFLYGTEATTLDSFRSREGILTPIELDYHPGKLQICPSLPELDFPIATIPENVVGCGPIFLPSPPVSETDPELATWLKRHSTILINLGTLHIPCSATASAMAKSIAAIIDENPDLQVLWKLKYDWKADSQFQELIAPKVAADRVRITSWLVPDTVSILSCGNIACFVHHGGANSFFEACYAGVRQIALPVWFDTYIFAAKVERLGVGVYGSKKSAPEVNSGEFLSALKRVLTDEGMKDKARALGELCRKSRGRELACDKIAELAEMS
jgi:hypothetical protein